MTTPSSNTTHYHKKEVEPTPPTMSRSLKSSSSLGSHQSDSGYHQTMGSTQGSNRCPTPETLNAIRNDLQYDVNDQYNYGWPLQNDTTTDDHSKMHVDQFDDDHSITHSQENPISGGGGQFTGTCSMDQPGHPVASQISVTSFEGTSQPSLGNSQRFSPPGNYDMSLPVTQGSFQDPSQQSSAHHGEELDNMPSKGGNLHSPNISNPSFHFSPSMEKLNDFHSNSSRPMSQDNLGNSPFRTNSFHHAPTLSQEPPSTYNMPGHGQHDNFSMQPPTDPYNMMVMSQVDQHGGAWPWNPRMYTNMHSAGYPPRGGPPFRNQFNRPDFGMREPDRSSVSSNYSDYDFSNPYPGMYPPTHNQFKDMDKKRKMSQQDPQDGRGRGYPPHAPPYTDMYGYQRQFYHGSEEDSSMEVALSQPAAYMMYPPHNPYNRYHGYQSHMGPGGPPPQGMGGQGVNRMNSGGGAGGGRVKNVPSGYSLSQGGEPRMRNMGLGNDKMFHKPRKSTLKNGGEKK